MNEDLARDYLSKSGFSSGFSSMQADALTTLLAEMATKDDLKVVRADVQGTETRLRSEVERNIAELRSDLIRAISETRTDLTEAIAHAQTQMMRWGIAMIVAMSAIFTLLDIFID